LLVATQQAAQDVAALLEHVVQAGIVGGAAAQHVAQVVEHTAVEATGTDHIHQFSGAAFGRALIGEDAHQRRQSRTYRFAHVGFVFIQQAARLFDKGVTHLALEQV